MKKLKFLNNDAKNNIKYALKAINKNLKDLDFGDCTFDFSFDREDYTMKKKGVTIKAHIILHYKEDLA